MTRHSLTSALFACALVVLAAGCNATREDQIRRADLTLSAASDSVRIGVSSGYLKDPQTLAAARFALIAANDVMEKVHAAYKAGDTTGVDFWLGQFLEVMAKLPVPAGEK